MLDQILSLIKKIIPKPIFRFFQPAYHWTLAKLSAAVFGFPSNKMIVVGVTGTAGKSSTCYFTAQILESVGFKVGMITTTLFKIDKKEWLNDKKMTTLGRFQMQKMLWQIQRVGCNVVIIETSSQGVTQFRHLGINYDILVLTNLYPEHLEAHGGFENYKLAKGKLFKYLNQCHKKSLKEITKYRASLSLGAGNKEIIGKTIIVNGDDENAEYFLGFKADKKNTFNGEKKLETALLGEYNTYNINAAVEVAEVLGVAENKIVAAVKNLKPLPGRLEFIENERGIKIIVDYAFEPKAMEKLYETIKDVPHQKIIHVLSSAGGGRDKARRPILGKLAAENADIVIVTNEDPYDEEPQEIIEQVANGVEEIRKYGNKEIEIMKILDRREAIRKALELAEKGDLILITGKGAEQAICVKNGKKIKWDDREVAREELKR
ncbi:MAG: UDP-N-acetylmuramyl-tripeptide synthetase [Patescibacteria group bacterium]|nr:UDP-N-acetylmuramyl-tripeptide synthetase [Patescibacteria group bacterium]